MTRDCAFRERQSRRQKKESSRRPDAEDTLTLQIHVRAGVLAAWLACVLLVLQPLRVCAFPKSQGSVTDVAGVLHGSSRTEIESLLRAAEQQTTVEIALVTVPSLEGLTVENYANKLFKQWAIGKKGKDNGVLILVAPTERKMRIEVGYGLEPILPDGLAGEVIRTDFLPRFAKNDYTGGILQGTRHVVEIVGRNQAVSADERRELDRRSENRPPALLMTLGLAVFIAPGAWAVGFGIRSKTIFPLIWGGIFGGVPFVLALVPFFNAWIWVLIPAGVAMLAWGYKKGGSPRLVKKFRGTSGHGPHSTGWVMGSSSTSSGGGSGSSGGFGGGSSGGGGASGSW